MAMRRATRRGALLVAAAAAGLLGLLLPTSSVPAPAQDTAGAEETSAPRASGPMSEVLQLMRSEIDPLQKQVEAGQIVSQFGEKANSVLVSLVGSVGDASSGLERSIDSMLESLFLRQLGLLRQQLAQKFERMAKPIEALQQADEAFVQQAEDLVRPGSSWSYEHERYALRAMLEDFYRRESSIAQEKEQAVVAAQSTVEIISKLQSHMETMQTRLQSMRAGSPWFLSSSWRIPGTPLQLIGRYQQGRGNIELNLSPDKDPANSEAGFVGGVGPANVGVALNVGM